LKKLYDESNLNCYNLMYGLYYLHCNHYDKIKFDNIRNMLPEFMRYVDSEPSVYNYPKDSVETEIINLKGEYTDIGSVDFFNEESLKKFIRKEKDVSCWSLIVYNECIGYFDTGCQWGVVSGQGAMYKIELVDKNKIRFTLIESWMS